jgi:hypothetical protein
MRQLQCTLLLLLLELIDEAAYYGTKMLTNFKIFSATHQIKQAQTSWGKAPGWGQSQIMGPRMMWYFSAIHEECPLPVGLTYSKALGECYKMSLNIGPR